MSEDLDEVWANVKSDALRLLAFKPRSTSELRQRLKLKKHPEEWVEKVLSLMTQQGLLNDEQFAKMFALSRFQSQPTGRNKIRRDLTQKGLSARWIEGALASIDPASEKDSALLLAQKRMALMKGLPPLKQKMRLMGYLRRRGFSGEVVNFAMKACFKNHEDFE